MPGHYTEPTSREAPTHDPACDEFELGDGSVSYEYQVECPNDQSLVFIQGREVGAENPPSPPLTDRHGIPDEGDCVRCNLQIEGSGVLPNDVLLDAATDPEGTELKELGVPIKDVGIRADRADGLVVKNMTFAHAAEHGLYIMETDGYLVEDSKYFYNGEYGTLIFNSDHGLTDTLRGHGSRRLGDLPRVRLPTPARMPPTIRPSSTTTRRACPSRSGTATSTTTRSATRARWVTRPA